MYKQRNHSQLLTDSSPEPVAMWPTKVGVWKSVKGYYWFSKSQWAQWRDYIYHLLTRAPNTKHYVWCTQGGVSQQIEEHLWSVSERRDGTMAYRLLTLALLSL